MSEEKLKDINIELLEFPLNVRTRPGMYIGAVDNASKLLSEIIDNAVDEVYDGNNKLIYTKSVEGFYIVADLGRGIPVKTAVVMEKHGEGGNVTYTQKKLDITQAELSISSLHSGSKFNKTSSLVGQNGVGSACTSALSSSYILLATLGEKHERVETMPEALIAEYKKLGGNKDYHFIEYHKGEFFKRGFINLDEFKDTFGFDLGIDFKPATLVAFKPDDTIFVSPKASYPANLKFVKKIAEVNKKNLEIYIEDKKFADDLPMYQNNVDSTLLTKKDDSINPYMRIVSSFRVNENWNCKDRCASVNGLQTNEGIHVTYFEKAFHNAWGRHYFEAKWTELCSIDYWIICLANEPVFDSQTKVRLKNLPGIDMKDTYALEQQIIREFKKNYQEWDLYAEKVRQNLKNVQDLGKIELIKTKVFIAAETSGRNAAKFLPKKLKDCYSKSREQCQLWIVEGESAAGSLVKARDPAIHAILPLKGRPMTTVYKDIEEVLENDEMRDLISCIGVGVKDYYNLDKVRYGKIVIATDADVDGFAIASSVLATIIDHMKFLIDKGFVYISVAPLYYQNGKYFYTNADFDKLDKNKPFTRFKGLGELSPNQLYDSMLNPKNQILIQVTSDRVEETLALLTRTGARRDLMIENGVVSEEFLKYEKVKTKLK